MYSTISNIPISKVIKFDNKKHIPYNKAKINRQPEKDEFVSSQLKNHIKLPIIAFMGKRMKKEDIETLQSSEELKNSPIAFLGEYITDYLSGSLPEDEFVQKTSYKSKEARIYFSVLPKEVRKQNLSMFKNEFDLSNSIMQSFEDNLTGDALKENVEKSVVEYVAKHKKKN